MSTRTPRAVIVSDGGLASLIAAAIEHERGGDAPPKPGQPMPAPGAVWAVPPASADGADEAYTAAAKAQAAAYGLDTLGEAELPSVERVAAKLGLAGQRDTLTLIRAGYLAAMKGCGRVVWPIRVEPGRTTDDRETLDRTAAVLDRALLVGRLISIDLRDPRWAHAGIPEVTIETPFVDLTDAQLVDLAIDLDIDSGLCWWGEPFGAQAPGAEAERARWGGLLGVAAS